VNADRRYWNVAVVLAGHSAPSKRPSGCHAAAGFTGNRSISGAAAGTMIRPDYSERPFDTRESGVVIEAYSMGMLSMIPTGWRSGLLRAASRTLEALPEGRLAHGMNMFTLLGDAVGGCGGAAAGEWSSETGRRQHLGGIHHPGGERRLLFGAGKGPAEAVAEAKQIRSVLIAEWISGGDRRRVVEARSSGGEFLLLSWVNPSRSICSTICNSRAPLGFGWASVALRPAYGV